MEQQFLFVFSYILLFYFSFGPAKGFLGSYSLDFVDLYNFDYMFYTIWQSKFYNPWPDFADVSI